MRQSDRLMQQIESLRERARELSDHSHPETLKRNEVSIRGYRDELTSVEGHINLLLRAYWEALDNELKSVAARCKVLAKALHVIALEKCPVCPGKEGTHDDRCWVAILLEDNQGPEYDAACAAVMESS